jgi:hypothetical protein
MNPVFKDLLRHRRWWLMLQFAALVFLWATRSPSDSDSMILFLELVSVIAALKIGTLRVYHTLPISRNIVASGLSWFAFGAGAGTNLLGMVIGLLISPLSISSSMLALHAVIFILAVGTLRFLLLHPPTRTSATAWGQIRFVCLAICWGLCCIVFFALVRSARGDWETITPGQMLVLWLAGVFTVKSLFKTTTTLIDTRQPVFLLTSTSSNRGLPDGVTGWRVWILEECLVLAMPVTLTLLFLLKAEKASDLWEIRFAIAYGMVLVVRTSMEMASLRACRGLPISRARYAFLMLVRPAVSGSLLVIIWGLLVLFIGKRDPDWNLMLFFCFISSLGSLAQALVVLFPRTASLALLLMAVILSVPLFNMLHKSQAPLYWLPVLSVLLYLSSWLLHRRWLLTSNQLYRSNDFMSSKRKALA